VDDFPTAAVADALIASDVRHVLKSQLTTLLCASDV